MLYRPIRINRYSVYVTLDLVVSYLCLTDADDSGDNNNYRPIKYQQ